MEFDPSECDWSRLYRLVTTTVVPRPTGWISTRDADGNGNLDPFSSFTYRSAADRPEIHCGLTATSPSNVTSTTCTGPSTDA